jgi:hypothetical protein
MFLNEEEMVTDMLLYQMSEFDKYKISTLPAVELDSVCAFTEATIIKLYRLDDDNNPHVDQAVGAANRPSIVSARVVKRIWSQLTGERIPLSLFDY